MNIVFLDKKTLGDDIDISCFSDFGNLIVYDTTSPDERAKRVEDADIILTNKVVIDDAIMAAAPKLKYIGIAATGYNNVVLPAARKREIAVTNVCSYSTDAVAGHTFALLFKMMENVSKFDEYVKSGSYSDSGLFTWHGNPFTELAGKTWGIIGLGEIGRRVAGIAGAFGCRVVYYSTSGANDNPNYERVTFEQLLAESDIVSVHAPLNAATEKLMNYEAFLQMKKTAYFINVGRGPIVVESDLARAVDENRIAGAGLDVFDKEPLPADSPLLKATNKEKLVLTPHVAWAGYEARTRLVHEMYSNIKAFVNSEKRNRVD